MIYDDKTLETCGDDVLINHEKELREELKTNTHYWLTTYNDNEHWAYKVSSTVECLKQVRKHIIKRKIY